MATDGIWMSEFYGPYGWENHGVVRLKEGQIFGGDAQQYTTGEYRMSGTTVQANLEVNYYGSPRTMFGGADRRFTTILVGDLADETINGKLVRDDRPNMDLLFRLKRLEVH